MATRIGNASDLLFKSLPLLTAGGVYRVTSCLMDRLDEQNAVRPTALTRSDLSKMAYLNVLNQRRLASVDRSLGEDDELTSRLITQLQVLSMLSSCNNTENAVRLMFSKEHATEALVSLQDQSLAGEEFEKIKSCLKEITESGGLFNHSVSDNFLDDLARSFATQCRGFWPKNRLNREHFRENSLFQTARQIIELRDPSQVPFKVFQIKNPSSFPGLHVWSDDQLETIIQFLENLKSKVQDSAQFSNVEADISNHLTLFQQIRDGKTEVSEPGLESFRRIFLSFAEVYKNQLPVNFANEVDSSIEEWSKKFNQFEEGQLTIAQRFRRCLSRSGNFRQVVSLGMAGLVYSMMTSDLFSEQ